jgi:hypothetical protein
LIKCKLCQANDFYTEVLGFCACGNPEEILIFIKKILVLLADEEKSPHYSLPPEFSNDIFHSFFLLTLDSKGLLEHGSSIYGSCLTSIGKTHHDLLNSISNEDMEKVFSNERLGCCDSI